MATKSDNLYSSAHFALELDGFEPFLVKSVDGGHAKTELVTHQVNTKDGAVRQAGKRKHEDVKIVVGLSNTNHIWNWVKSFVDGECTRHNGALIAADYNYCEQARREFSNALIASVDFPKFDAKDKNSATVTLTISPEAIKYSPPKEGGKLAATDSANSQLFMKSSEFEVAFVGMPESATARIAKVDGFSIKTKIIEYHVGTSLAPIKLAGKLEWPNISMYVPEADSGPFVELMQKQLDGLQHERQEASLTYFDNGHKPKGTFEFHGCTIISVAADKHDTANEEMRLVKVEMGVESIVFKPA